MISNLLHDLTLRSTSPSGLLTSTNYMGRFVVKTPSQIDEVFSLHPNIPQEFKNPISSPLTYVHFDIFPPNYCIDFFINVRPIPEIKFKIRSNGFQFMSEFSKNREKFRRAGLFKIDQPFTTCPIYLDGSVVDSLARYDWNRHVDKITNWESIRLAKNAMRSLEGPTVNPQDILN